MEKIRIRPSQVKNFLNCSYKWFRDHLHNPIRKVSSSAHIGSSLHKAAETYYTQCINSHKWENYSDDYVGLSIDTFRNICKEDEPSDYKELNMSAIEDTIKSCTNNYINKASTLNKNIPIAVEKYYKVDVNHPLISEIGGTLDIVGDDFIGDIKTMKRVKAPQEYALQQSIYALLREKNNEPINDLIIHRVNTKDSKKIDSVSIINSSFCTLEDYKNQGKLVIKAILNITKEYSKTGNEYLFRGNPYSYICKGDYCAYYNDCPYRKLV